MKKRLWVAALLVAAAAVGIIWKLERGKPARPMELAVYFSGDTRGRIAPCGCFTGQNGGLTRLKTYLNANASPLDIKVDVGDAIGGAEDYEIMQYRYILQAYATMGYDAVNIGHRELRLPLQELEKLKAAAPVTLVSANVFDAASGKRVFEPFKVIQRGSSRIGIVGIVDPQGLGENLGRGLRVDSIEETLEKLLPRVKKETDTLILLAFTDEDGLNRLANQFYEFKLILGGKVSQPSQRLVRVNRSAILYTANESRTIGMVKVAITPQFEARDFEMRLLHDKIPEDPGILLLAAQYREEVRKTHLSIDDLDRIESDLVPGIKTRATYVGVDACLECHTDAAHVWKDSAHAQAFSALQIKKADADPSCIPCHSVGFGTASGYRRSFQATKLVNVTCESCHGPGSLHVTDRKSGQKPQFDYRPLAAGDCKQCHYGEYSRPFDWDTFWPIIKHAKDKK